MSQTRMKRPLRAREHVRLATALGTLAMVAITAGGLASLAAGTPMLPEQPQPERSPSALGWVAPAEALFDDEVLATVERAEHSMAQAREVLARARARDQLDPATIAAYEARLAPAEDSPSEAAAARPVPRPNSRSKSGRSKSGSSSRQVLRPRTSSARKL